MILEDQNSCCYYDFEYYGSDIHYLKALAALNVISYVHQSYYSHNYFNNAEANDNVATIDFCYEEKNPNILTNVLDIFQAPFCEKSEQNTDVLSGHKGVSINNDITAVSNDTQYSYNYYKIGAATVVLLAFTYGNPKLFTTSLFAAFGLKVFNQASDIKEVQNVRSLNVFDVCSKIITGAEYTILGIASSSIIGKIAKDMMPGNIPYKDSSAKIIGAIFSPLATFAYSTLLNSYYQVSPQNKSLVDTMVYYTSKTTIKEIFDALIVDKVSNIYPVAKIPIKIATQAFSSYFVKVTKNAISNQNVGELYNLYTLEQTIIVSTSRILGKQVMSGIMTEAPLAISSGIVALCAKTIYKDLKKK